MSKVSVVVPCYRVEKYIRELIESLQRQTLSDTEVILVDDGSPDQTGAICDEYASRDARLHVIHKPNGGVSAARNDGMKAATSDYIIFADSDDYLPGDALEILYAEAVRTGADIVIGDVNQVFENEEKMGRFYEKEFVTEDEGLIRELIKTVFYKNYCPMPYRGKAAFGYGGPWNKLVRRSMLVENGIAFDSRTKGVFDDLIYSAYILAAAHRVAYIPRNVYNYRMLDSSITMTYKRDMPEINRAIFDVWGEFLQKYNQDGAFTAPFYANVLRRFDETLNKYFFSPDNPKGKAERKRELKEMMHSTPYTGIPVYTEAGKLGRRHRMEYMLLKTGSASLVWLFYGFLSSYRRHKAG